MKYVVGRIIPYAHHNDTSTIYFSEKLATKLNIPFELPFIQVQCSRNTLTVPLVIMKGEEAFVKIGQQSLEQLYLLDEERTFFFSYNSTTNTVSIGPIIALMTEILEEEPIDLKTISQFSIELTKFSEEVGAFFYVFTLPQSLAAPSLEGYVFTNNEWIKHTLPFPHIIHNRLHKRKNEKSNVFLSFTEQLKDWNVPYFNESFLDKWTVYYHLQEAEHLKPYLPETELYNKETILNWLERETVIFLKPINGSQGRHILKIEKEDKNFIISHSSFQQEKKHYLHTAKEVINRLAPYVNRRDYLIQKGIPLFQVEGKPVDFRYLCHRTENDRWKITSSVSRISKPGQFVSNIAQGGQLSTVQQALRASFSKEEIKHLQKHMRTLAIDVAYEISSVATGMYAELGIDLAIDVNGKPWIIEVNTKPSKNVDGDEQTTAIRPSAKAIILYCLYLVHETTKEGRVE